MLSDDLSPSELGQLKWYLDYKGDGTGDCADWDRETLGTIPNRVIHAAHQLIDHGLEERYTNPVFIVGEQYDRSLHLD